MDNGLSVGIPYNVRWRDAVGVTVDACGGPAADGYRRSKK